MTDFPYVVVGGGVHGCAIAYELSRRGETVLLLEASTLAAGSSGGPGFRGVRANQRDYRELPFIGGDAPKWPDLSAELGHDIGYHAVGSLYLYEREASGSRGGLVSLDARAAVQNAHGIRTEILDAEQVREMLPEVSADVRAGLWCPNDGTADQKLTTLAYASAAKDAGATFRDNAPVVKVVVDDRQHPSVVLQDGETIRATSALIIATNAHARSLLKASHVDLVGEWGVYPQAITVGVTDSELPLGPLVGHDHRSMSTKRIDSQTIMISGGWRGRTVNGQGVPIAEQVLGNLREAAAILPILEGREPTDVYCDRLESSTLDQLPIIDRIPGLGATYLATGWSGHGFAIAPAVAQHLTTWLIDGSKPRLLDPFAWGRFQPC